LKKTRRAAKEAALLRIGTVDTGRYTSPRLAGFSSISTQVEEEASQAPGQSTHPVALSSEISLQKRTDSILCPQGIRSASPRTQNLPELADETQTHAANQSRRAAGRTIPHEYD
jgi:hypothetical protein